MNPHIEILRTRGDWMYAALPNDLRGWIHTMNAASPAVTVFVGRLYQTP